MNKQRDLAGISTHGLHSATWRNIRKALRKLGGRPMPGTNNHDSMLIELPTHAKITVGKAKDADEQVRVDGLKQLMYEVQAARLEPLLFLAILDGVGCAWVTKPADVTHLERFLRQTGQRVDTEAAWRHSLAAFTRQRANAIDDEPEPPTEDAASDTTPDPAPDSTDATSTHPFTLAGILSTAGVPPAFHNKAYHFVNNLVKRRSPEIAGLIDSGDIIRVPHPTYATREETRFTERAALDLAERVAAKYAPSHATAFQPRVANDEPTPERATAPQPHVTEDEPMPTPELAPPPAAEPTATVTADPDLPPARLTIPRNAPTGPVDSVGTALTILCFERGLMPEFRGSLIDVDATLNLLANDALHGATTAALSRKD